MSAEKSTASSVQYDALGTYLREHIAASHAAEDLAKQMVERDEDPQVTAFIRGLADDIPRERAYVEALLDLEQDDRGLLRKGLDVAFDVAGKAGRLVELATPSVFAQLEALAIGVWGKRLLWGTLKRLAEIDDRFGSVPVDDLSDQAEKQEIELLRLRQDAIVLALSAVDVLPIRRVVGNNVDEAGPRRG